MSFQFITRIQKLTPQGPTIDDLLQIPSGMDSTYVYANLHRKDNPTFSITNKRLRLAKVPWKTLKKAIVHEFLSPIRDLTLLQIIRMKFEKFVPVRSGRLLDTFLNTAAVIRKAWYNTRFAIAFQTQWSTFRPRPIKGNVQHNPPETGEGEYYVPTHLIPNRHFLRMIAPGEAEYILDDPVSVNDPIWHIYWAAEETIKEDLIDVWDNTLITLHIP